MNIEILQRDARQIAYIRVTGPYEQALPAGFATGPKCTRKWRESGMPSTGTTPS